MRSIAFSLAAMGLFAALCLLAGILPGAVIDGLAPVVQALQRRAHAGAACGAVALDRADARPRAARITACWCSCSSPLSAWLTAFAIHRFASHALRRGAGLGLRLPRSAPGDAIHRRQLRPADPPRVRHRGVRRARDRDDAAARRHVAPPASRRRCATRSGMRSTRRSPARSAAVTQALNHLQFLTIRRYLSLVFVALVVLLLALALWQ